MHKAFIYIDSTDESGQATVAAGVTEVIAAYGVRVLVRATDEELAALEASGLRVELANEMDSLPFPGMSIGTEAPPAMESGAEPESRTVTTSKKKAGTKSRRPKKQSTTQPASASREILEEPAYWLVQFVGPPLPEWVDGVRATGAEIIGPMPPNIILVRMTTAQADAVRALDRVQWVGLYQASYKVHPEITSAPSPPPETSAQESKASPKAGTPEASTPAPPELVAVTVVLFDANALASVMGEIESRGGIVQRADIDTIICDVPPSAITDIAALSVVARISPYSPPTLAMQMARKITRVQTVFDTHGLDGEGEIVCVADTGLDRGDSGIHGDFSRLGVAGSSRVIAHYSFGGRLGPPDPVTGVPPVLWNDPFGHGTHVAGIAVGNGSTSGRHRPNSGVAFKAQLVMQSLANITGGVVTPGNLNSLFGPVYTTDGARVHNNSWGGYKPLSQYELDAYRIDEFVWNHPDMVIVFAAANLGTDGPRSTPSPTPPPPLDPAVDLLALKADGVVDLASLSPEATNRNAITVGGTENTRTGIWGSTDLTWNLKYEANGYNRFAVEPQSTDAVANNEDHLMAASSRGPTLVPTIPPAIPPATPPPPFRGDRIKPDVVAPGSSILSCLSHLVPLPLDGKHTLWGASPPAGYVYDTGTSMAAPHVAGMCALIRQYLRKVHHLSDPNNAVIRSRRPSAALIKALLVHGARAVTGLTQAQEGTIPNNHQGWGRVDLRRTLFSLLKSSLVNQDDKWLPRRTIFIDDPNITLNSVPPAANTKRSVTVKVVDNSVALRATLVWTDHPGTVASNTGVLINKLELSVTHRKNGIDIVTRFTLPAAIGPSPPDVSAVLDPLSNNVQQISIASPEVGDYVVEVTANDIGSFATAGVEQDFALVISGSISHSDHRSPGVMAPLPDVAFVGLAPDKTGRERHDGLAPSPEPSPGDSGSPDIWVSREQNSDPTHAVARLEVGPSDVAYVYVRVRNLGFAPANGTQINLYWADPRTPMAYPADWKTDDLKVDGVTGNQRLVDVPARTKVGGAWHDGEVVVGPFEWKMPRGVERVVFFARAVHPDDPMVNEGDPRWDNNIARHDFLIQDNTTQVQGQPSTCDKIIFWFISGFSTPRDIELRVALAYQDIRDGQVKPLPAGVEVEVWDYDSVTNDEKLAQGRTAISANAAGQPTSVLHLTFSTYESGERWPDIYLKVLKPAGPDFAEFVNNSFFAAGAATWSSRDQTTASGGFFAEGFSGKKIGITEAVQAVIVPSVIYVHAAFEYFSQTSNQFEKLPQGIEVKVRDSNRAAPQPLLARATTDAKGEIATALPRRADYRPSIYFEIERTVATKDDFVGVDYFLNQNLWDSRTRQGEIIAADNTVSSTAGHFQDWTQDKLVAANQRLRFRLESPGILMHLRFQYYDRDGAGGYVDLPPGTEVEAWEDAGASSLVKGTVGANGRVELTVPKGGRPQLDLNAHVVMRRRLTGDPKVVRVPTVEVSKAGNVMYWDTKNHQATDGSDGTFKAVIDHVATAAAPLVFQIGAAADNADEPAAPFILKVIGQLHDWLRTRWGSDWTGILGLRVDLFNGPAADGSRFTSNDNTIHLNIAHGGASLDHRNRDVIAHHYGHLVLESLFVNPLRTIPTVPNHDTYDPGAKQPNQQRRVLAEGWADYIASRHRAAPVPPDSSANQTGWRGTDNKGANSSGEMVPLAVANALWRLDEDVVGQGNGNNINDPINQHRFRALIANAVKSLPQADESQQVALYLYRAIQSANLAASDLIPANDIVFIRQLVRRVFEANGMVFARGRFTGAAVRLSKQKLDGPVAKPEQWRFKVGPADRAKLNIAEMGRITAYRLQAAPAGTFNFVNLEPVVVVTADNQSATIDVDFTAARKANVLLTAGNYDIRVVARDEFSAWDTFADDFTGNTAGGTGVTNNNTWQRTRLNSILAAPIAVP